MENKKNLGNSLGSYSNTINNPNTQNIPNIEDSVPLANNSKSDTETNDTKPNDILATIINTLSQRVLAYHNEGDLFNNKHNNLLISNAKALAIFMKMQQTPIAKNDNNRPFYTKVIGACHEQK